MNFNGCTKKVETSIGTVICKKISCNTTERLVSRAFGIGDTWFGSYPTVACIVRKIPESGNKSVTVTTDQIITAIKSNNNNDLVKAGWNLSISAKLPVYLSKTQLTYTGKINGMEYNTKITTDDI
ncbi:hypothetical protein AYI70_g11029, partial [Smittium culicis]